MSGHHFIPHPDAERFDAVTLETIERWKESELSGDEWRFSYVARFWQHGEVVAESSGRSIADVLLQAAALYDGIKVDHDKHPGGYYGNLAEVCCQPGCPNPWTVLLHPLKRYTRDGDERVRPYNEKDVRGFCERHKYRGDCAQDDADHNYVEVETRFPQGWVES